MGVVYMYNIICRDLRPAVLDTTLCVTHTMVLAYERLLDYNSTSFLFSLYVVRTGRYDINNNTEQYIGDIDLHVAGKSFTIGSPLRRGSWENGGSSDPSPPRWWAR
jgi:hypothetical protein